MASLSTRCIDCYANFVVKRPCLMIFFSILMAFFFIALGVMRGVMPDLENAGRGFEARGTSLAGRIYVIDRALEGAQCSGEVSALPDRRTYHHFAEYPSENRPYPECQSTDPPSDTCFESVQNQECNDYVEEDSDERPRCAPGTDVSDCGNRRQLAAVEEVEEAKEATARAEVTRQLQGPPITCTDRRPSSACTVCYAEIWNLSPEPSPVQLVFERADGGDLMSASSMIAMCELADEIYDSGDVHTCRRNHQAGVEDGTCCGARTLGTYVALLAGRASCYDITDADVAAFHARLRQCRGMDLAYVRVETYDTNRPPSPPCNEFNAVFDSLNALIDTAAVDAFQASSGTTNIQPNYVKLMMSYEEEEELAQLHWNMLEGRMHSRVGDGVLTAYDLANGGVKFSIFNEILMGQDVGQIGMGIFVIIIMTWLYSGSLFFTLCGFFQIFLACAMAFGVMMSVFYMPFFGFLNCTGLFLCIGVGADDLFVMLQAFDDCIRNRDAAKRGMDAELIKEVVLEAGTATFVTTLTTAGAFFASATSSITAIRGFGLYCGLVVVCDWMIMILFIPPLAVFHQKYIRTACCTLQSGYCPNTPIAANERQLKRPAMGVCFEKCLGTVVTNKYLKYLWVVGMLGLAFGIGSGFIGAGLRLPYPSSSEMQMLADDSPFERYCCVGPRAQSLFTLGAPGSENGRRQVVFVFGLVPEDNGDYWDPSSYPTAQFTNPDFTTPAAQQFMHDFVVEAHAASWFAIPPEEAAEPPSDLATNPRAPFNTTFEIIFLAAEMPCGTTRDQALGTNPSSTCCSQSRGSFPFAPAVFSDCLADLATFNHRFQIEYSGDTSNCGINGCPPPQSVIATSGMDFWSLTMRRGVSIFFDGATPQVLTFVFPTSTSYTEVYDETNDWWNGMLDWTGTALATSPIGGFISVPFGSLNYFSLQTAMAESASNSAYIALLIACLVLMVVTANVLVALYTTVTVILIILTCSGCLYMAGWEQGIMESIIISSGIGMACDFAAHIGFAYRQANIKGEASTRADLANIAVRRMMPALTAAAFSTSIMALFMTQAGTLFTIRFGIFVLLLMSFGWFFATFFLVPLLASVGPLGKCGEPLALCQSRNSTTFTTKALENASSPDAVQA